MNDPWLIEKRPDGVTERLHFDESGETFAIELKADVEPVLEANKRRQNDGTNGFGQTREWRHLACIPPIFIEKWLNEDGVNLLQLRGADLSQFIKRKLNDPDWRWLRVADGRI